MPTDSEGEFDQLKSNVTDGDAVVSEDSATMAAEDLAAADGAGLAPPAPGAPVPMVTEPPEQLDSLGDEEPSCSSAADGQSGAESATESVAAEQNEEDSAEPTPEAVEPEEAAAEPECSTAEQECSESQKSASPESDSAGEPCCGGKSCAEPDDLDEIVSFFSQAATGLREGVSNLLSSINSESMQLYNISKLRLEIHALEKRQGELFAEIGENLYLMRPERTISPEIKELFRMAEELEEGIHQKNLEIDSLQEGE